MFCKKVLAASREFEVTRRGRSTSRLQVACALAAALALAACETAPVKRPEPVPAPAVVGLPEYMQQASKAVADGSRERARETYRIAAKAYPASSEPWSKLSEDYFAGADYGNAILAAQEVLLRNSNDTVAASVLAVSGLRVSASALQTLRAQNRIAGDTRNEAQTMTQTLRDVLGEEVLVPRPAPVPAAAASSPPKARPPVARPRPAPKPADAAAPAAAPSAGNPFDKLK